LNELDASSFVPMFDGFQDGLSEERIVLNGI